MKVSKVCSRFLQWITKHPSYNRTDCERAFMMGYNFGIKDAENKTYIRPLEKKRLWFNFEPKNSDSRR